MHKKSSDLPYSRLSVLSMVLVLALSACGKEEGIPAIRSTAGLAMEGSRHIGVSGAPDVISESKGLDTSISIGGWSTAALPLPKPSGFVVGARNGRLYFFDRKDSLTRIAELTDKAAADQLLTAGNTIYAISVAGTVNAFSLDGKLLWSSGAGSTLTAQAVIASDVLVLPTAHELQAIDTLKGNVKWRVSTPLTFTAVSYSTSTKLIACGLTAGSSSSGDSILCLDPSGSKRSEVELSGLEITSNLAFASEKDAMLIVGALAQESSGRRDARVVALKGFAEGKLATLWSHTVPFLAGNIAINKVAAFVSGFRSKEGEVLSGVAAFRLSDTTTLWQRSFTEPLIAPIAASDANVYFVSNFESDAIVPSRGLLITLQAGDGKTVSQKSAPGAEQGLLPVMPMPDEDGRFLLPDATRPVVFVFDRSSLKRMF